MIEALLGRRLFEMEFGLVGEGLARSIAGKIKSENFFYASYCICYNNPNLISRDKEIYVKLSSIQTYERNYYFQKKVKAVRLAVVALGQLLLPGLTVLIYGTHLKIT